MAATVTASSLPKDLSGGGGVGGVLLLVGTPPPLRKPLHVFHLRTRAASYGTMPRIPEIAAADKRYEFDPATDLIGSGAYGRVFKALDTSSGCIVAIKRIKPPKHGAGGARNTHAGREIAAMMKLRHENIVRMIDYYVDKTLHIVFEFAKHGDLFTWLQQKYEGTPDDLQPVVSSRTLVRIARQVGSALAYCHKHNVAQRDIKLENIIIVEAEPNIAVKLVDFGLSFGVLYSENSARTTTDRMGSWDYAAPEILMGDGRAIDPYKADVWSYGIVLFTISHFVFPWRPKRDIHKVPTFPIDLSKEIGVHVRPGMRSVMGKALQFYPDDRPEMDYLAAEERVGEVEADDGFSVLTVLAAKMRERRERKMQQLLDAFDASDNDGPLPPFPTYLVAQPGASAPVPVPVPAAAAALMCASTLSDIPPTPPTPASYENATANGSGTHWI